LKPVCNKIEHSSNHPLKTTLRQEKHDSKPLLKGRDRETQARVQTKRFRHLLCRKRFQLQNGIKSKQHDPRTNRTTCNYHGESDRFKRRPIIFHKSRIHKHDQENSCNDIGQGHSYFESCPGLNSSPPLRNSQKHPYLNC